MNFKTRFKNMYFFNKINCLRCIREKSTASQHFCFMAMGFAKLRRTVVSKETATSNVCCNQVQKTEAVEFQKAFFTSFKNEHYNKSNSSHNPTRGHWAAPSTVLFLQGNKTLFYQVQPCFITLRIQPNTFHSLTVQYMDIFAEESCQMMTNGIHTQREKALTQKRSVQVAYSHRNNIFLSVPINK